MILPTEDPIETRLREAGSRPVPVRPLEEIQRRARRTRYRTRAVQSSAGLALAAAATAGVIALPGLLNPASGPDRGTQPAVSADPAGGVDAPSGKPGTCRTGYGHVGAFSDVPDLLYLPSAAAAGRPLATLVRLDRADCDPLPLAAVATRTVDGVVRSAVRIAGPGANPDREGFMGTVVRVDGVPGTLDAYVMPQDGDEPEDLVRADWVDPDGNTWSIEPRGLSPRALGELVSGLRVEGGVIDPASFPAGYQVAGADQLVQPARDRWRFHQIYPTDREEGEASVQIERGQDFAEVVAGLPEAARFEVDVAGESRPAVWYSGKLGMLVVQLSDDIVVTVRGFPERERATRIVESLQKVEPDDERLIVEEAPRDIPED